jgi:hypothetical protein
MKKALVCPNEPISYFDGSIGYRVAQVELTENIFPVANPLFWTDCADDVVADQFWYDPSDQQIKPNWKPAEVANG